MNSNQSRELTQKQKELVMRLEKIRNNRENTDKPKKNKPQRRNENVQQNRPTSRNSRKTVAKKGTDTASQRKYARPIVDRPTKAEEPIQEYKYEPGRHSKSVQTPRKRPINKKTKQKKTGNYITQLSGGGKLSQAIILSEILDKPIALRKKK